MKSSARVWLLGRELSARPGRTLLLLFCTGLMALFCGLALNVLFYLQFTVRPWAETLFPVERVLVRPGERDVAFFKMETNQIGEEDLQAIEDREEVRRVLPQMSASFPVMAEIAINQLDLDFASDVVLFGVPRELISGTLGDDVYFEHDPEVDFPVPVAVSSYFLDMYNMGLAEGSDLPKLSANAAISREFDLVLGSSFIGVSSTKAETRTERARIVGLTSDPMLVGLAVPLGTMRAWNDEFNAGAPPQYSVLHVDVADADAARALADDLREEGFRVELSADRLAQVRGALNAAGLLVGAGMIVILALAAVGVFTTVAMSARERRAVWGLHRATGLTPGALWFTIVAEALLIALIGGAIGAGAATGLLAGADAFLAGADLQLATLPGNPLGLQPAMIPGILALSALLTIVPFVLFSRKAGGAEPAELLTARDL